MNPYYNEFLSKVDRLIIDIYRITRSFPKEERYGITSQIRRAAVSIALNYIEGYARGRTPSFISFLEIAYGSSKECAYLLELSNKLSYIPYDQSIELKKSIDNISAILWKSILGLKKKQLEK